MLSVRLPSLYTHTMPPRQPTCTVHGSFPLQPPNTERPHLHNPYSRSSHPLARAHTCPPLAVAPAVPAEPPSYGPPPDLPCATPSPPELVGLALVDDAAGGLA